MQRFSSNSPPLLLTIIKSELSYTGTLEEEKVITLASFMKASLDRGLSRFTINSSILSAAADLFRYDDVPMHRKPLIKQLMKVVKESTPTPVQKKPLEMDHIKMMVALVKSHYLSLTRQGLFHDSSHDGLHDEGK